MNELIYSYYFIFDEKCREKYDFEDSFDGSIDCMTGSDHVVLFLSDTLIKRTVVP